MRNYIIGISCNDDAITNEAAHIIEYIHRIGMAGATYTDYVKYTYADNKFNKIIHYADTVKQCISNIYNIPIEYLYKEKYLNQYYSPVHNLLYDNDTKHILNSYTVTLDDLSDFTLAELIKAYSEKVVIIQLKLLIKYFTEIYKKYLDERIIISSTKRKALDIADKNGLCIISDVHYKNEARWLRYTDEDSYRGIIMIFTNKDNKVVHTDDDVTIDYCQYFIEYKSARMDLFYKLHHIMESIILNNK